MWIGLDGEEEDRGRGRAGGGGRDGDDGRWDGRKRTRGKRRKRSFDSCPPSYSTHGIYISHARFESWVLVASVCLFLRPSSSLAMHCPFSLSLFLCHPHHQHRILLRIWMDDRLFLFGVCVLSCILGRAHANCPCQVIVHRAEE